MLASNWAQSETSFRVSRVTGSLRVVSQALSRPFLKTFTAVYPYPADRAWVSEDEKNHEDHMNHKNLNHKKEASTLDRNGSRNILQKLAQFTKC